MKLTYNTIITVDGTQEEVIDWYKTFVHSQTACEQKLYLYFVRKSIVKLVLRKLRKLVTLLMTNEQESLMKRGGWLGQQRAVVIYQTGYEWIQRLSLWLVTMIDLFLKVFVNFLGTI